VVLLREKEKYNPAFKKIYGADQWKRRMGKLRPDRKRHPRSLGVVDPGHTRKFEDLCRQEF